MLRKYAPWIISILSVMVIAIWGCSSTSPSTTPTSASSSTATESEVESGSQTSQDSQETGDETKEVPDPPSPESSVSANAATSQETSAAPTSEGPGSTSEGPGSKTATSEESQSSDYGMVDLFGGVKDAYEESGLKDMVDGAKDTYNNAKDAVNTLKDTVGWGSGSDALQIGQTASWDNYEIRVDQARAKGDTLIVDVTMNAKEKSKFADRYLDAITKGGKKVSPETNETSKIEAGSTFHTTLTYKGGDFERLRWNNWSNEAEWKL